LFITIRVRISDLIIKTQSTGQFGKRRKFPEKRRKFPGKRRKLPEKRRKLGEGGKIGVGGTISGQRQEDDFQFISLLFMPEPGNSSQ
jgi:hypothetical protein